MLCSAACNPTNSSGVTWDCRPRTPAVGVANCTERYAGRRPGKWSSKYDWWKYNASQLVGGLWYSTQAAGRCGAAGGSAPCTWRVVETIKTINATCANEALFTAVRGKDPACFAGCGVDDFNITSDCFLDCFCAHHPCCADVPPACPHNTRGSRPRVCYLPGAARATVEHTQTIQCTRRA